MNAILRTVLVALYVVIGASIPGCSKNAPKTGTMNKSRELQVNDLLTINRNIYADQQNSSFLPVAGRFTGDEAWYTATGDSAGNRSPVALGLHGNHLVVSYGNLLVVLDRSSGDVLWSVRIRGNHAFSMDENGIVTLNAAGNFERLGYDGRAEKELYLSSVSSDTYLHFLRQVEDAYWFVYEQYPEPLSSPEDQPPPPVSRFVRYRPEGMHVVWQYTLPPKLLGSLVTRDLSRAFLATAERLYTFPTDATDDDAVTIMEFTKIVALSTDGAGNALLVDIVENVTHLKQVTPDGEVGWVVSFEQGQPSNQPPASSPEGYVYVVVGSNLHQIRGGEIVWTYPLPASAGDIAITVLADNCVLAAAGTALVHVSATGEEILTKWLDTPIGTRPIMDENGTVYYGGSDGIHCLR